MPHDVFISHSTAGKLTADAICNELESLGIRCWILPRDLKVGLSSDQSIANAVASCRIMIVVFADYASRSDRIERQLESAYNNGVMIIPFRSESTEMVSASESTPDSVHWLDALTPETSSRLRSLCERVRELLRPQTNDAAVPNKLTSDEPARGSEQEPIETVEPSPRQPGQPSRMGPTKALLLIMAPLLVVLGVGFWRTKADFKSGLPKQNAVMGLPNDKPAPEQIRIEEKFAAWDPGWGRPDANWNVTDGKLQLTPLLNSSALLINQTKGFKDAEVTVDVAMSKGENMAQLGGLIFWAKGYNDFYVMVVSAEGRFAVGRKLVGRWINPVAKTENTAVKTGIGRSTNCGFGPRERS